MKETMMDISGVFTHGEDRFQTAAHAALLVSHQPLPSGTCCCAQYQESGKNVLGTLT